MSLKFSNLCGENIITQNDEAQWKSVYSGGLCFSETSIKQSPLRLKFCGSSHIAVGYIEQSPDEIYIRRALNQMKNISDVRVHKSSFKIELRLSTDGRELVIDSGNNKTERFSLHSKNIWLAVYIKFGSASVLLESTNNKFSNTCGENIKLSQNSAEASLIDENPAAVCFIDRHFHSGETVNLQINPVSDPGKSSQPSRYYIKFGFIQDTSMVIKEKHATLFEVVGGNNTSDWKPDVVLEKIKCLGNLQVGVSDSGDFTFTSESGENGKIPIPSFDRETGIICLFELFRTKAKLLNVTRCHTYDYPSVESLSDMLPNSLGINETSLFNSKAEPVKSKAISSNNEQERSKTVSLNKEPYQKLGQEKKDSSSPVFDQQSFLNDSYKRIYSFGNSKSDLNTISFDTRDDNTSGIPISNGDSKFRDDRTRKDVMNIRLPSKDRTAFSEEDNNVTNLSTETFLRHKIDIKEQVDILTKENLELRTRVIRLEEENARLKLENDRLQNSSSFGDKPPEMFDGESPKSPTSPKNPLTTLIQKYCVTFVNDLELSDLCDHLYEKGQIRSQDYEDLQQLVKQNKRAANRHFLVNLIPKRAIQYDILLRALKDTKQEGLVQLFLSANLSKNQESVNT